MAETLYELAVAEQAAQAAPTETPPEPPTETTPEPAQVEVPSDPPLETPPEVPPAETPPEIDPFIAEAAEATGMKLEDLKTKEAFFQSYAAQRRKLSERDEKAKALDTILADPRVLLNDPQIRQALQADLAPPVAPPETTPPSDGPPEYNPTWEAIVQGENPPAEIVAKYHVHQQWQRQRAEKLLHSDILAKLASQDGLDGVLGELLDKRLNPILEQFKSREQQELEQAHLARVDAVLKPVAKNLFTGEQGDWENVTPLGAKVVEMYQSEPEFAKADGVRWLQRCIQSVEAQLPQPKPTRTPNPAANREPAVGAPPADTRSIEEILAEAEKNSDHELSLMELETLIAKHRTG